MEKEKASERRTKRMKSSENRVEKKEEAVVKGRLKRKRDERIEKGK